MDQIKIGKFIAECRKKKKLTQAELAEKLGITDRAISKWENGKSLPDSGVMLELCAELDITVNELLSGERIEMKKYDEKVEENLLNLTKENEEKNKKLLNIEILISIPAVAIGLALVFLASYANIPTYVRITLIVLGLILIFSVCFIAIRIEQTVGYYECGKCHHKYIPTYPSTLWAPHTGRTRYMKCPKCNKRSWNKKVISKDQKLYNLALLFPILMLIFI